MLRDSPEERYERIKVLALVNPAFMAEEYGLVAAPEMQRAYIVAKLKVAAVLNCRAEDIALVWDGSAECAPPQPEEILDVAVRGMRPLPATWAKLVEAGLPIYSYDAAAVSWSTRG